MTNIETTRKIKAIKMRLKEFEGRDRGWTMRLHVINERQTLIQGLVPAYEKRLLFWVEKVTRETGDDTPVVGTAIENEFIDGKWQTEFYYRVTDGYRFEEDKYFARKDAAIEHAVQRMQIALLFVEAELIKFEETLTDQIKELEAEA
jgi:hypothetical protein